MTSVTARPPLADELAIRLCGATSAAQVGDGRIDDCKMIVDCAASIAEQLAFELSLVPLHHSSKRAFATLAAVQGSTMVRHGRNTGSFGSPLIRTSMKVSGREAGAPDLSDDLTLIDRIADRCMNDRHVCVKGDDTTAVRNEHRVAVPAFPSPDHLSDLRCPYRVPMLAPISTPVC